MPAQEPGSRPHRPSSIRPHADVTVDRSAAKVTAALTNTGKVGVGFSVYPDSFLPFTATPVTVTRSAPGSYTWDATAAGGQYAFSVYGPDGFLASFAGTVVPAGQNSGQVPAVTAALNPGAGKVELTLANEGRQAVTFTLTPNDYSGTTQHVTVANGAKGIAWPANADGYYDVIITASTSDGFRRRYAGRIG